MSLQSTQGIPEDQLLQTEVRATTSKQNISEESIHVKKRPYARGIDSMDGMSFNTQMQQNHGSQSKLSRFREGLSLISPAATATVGEVSDEHLKESKQLQQQQQQQQHQQQYPISEESFSCSIAILKKNGEETFELATPPPSAFSNSLNSITKMKLKAKRNQVHARVTHNNTTDEERTGLQSPNEINYSRAAAILQSIPTYAQKLRNQFLSKKSPTIQQLSRMDTPLPAASPAGISNQQQKLGSLTSIQSTPNNNNNNTTGTGIAATSSSSGGGNNANNTGKVFKWTFLNKFDRVRQFIDKLKQSSTYISGYHRTNYRHLQLIGDRSDNIEEEMQLAQYSCILLWLESILAAIPIFSPDSLKVTCWNLLVSFCILLQFVMIPLKICFELEFDDAFIEFLLFYIPAFIFSTELVFRLNISYYFEGILVADRAKIISHYLFKTYYFWVDCITTITFLASKDTNHPLLITIVIFRVLQFQELNKEIDEHFQISQRFPSVWNLSKLFLLITLVAHFTGCGFHFIANIQSENGFETWLTLAKIVSSSWQVRYLYSLYWSSITMITVGYGDIVPITSAEKIYVIIMTLISTGVFAYSVNTIGSIFSEYAEKQESLKAKKHDISIYMRTRGISSNLQIEVIKYLDYINQEEMEATKKGQEVIALLSEQMKEKIQIDFYGRILKESQIFRTYSEPFLSEVALIMKERLYGPGEMVFSQGEQDSRLIFVIKGQLQLYISLAKKADTIVISSVDKGEVGQSGFFAEEPRDSNLRSLNVSHTAYILKEEFIEVLSRFPSDQERFCLMKDSILQNLQKQKQNCFACKSTGHTILNCQRIHFKRNKWLTILRSNHSKEQSREPFERKEGWKFKRSALITREAIRSKLIQFRGEKVAKALDAECNQDDQDWLMCLHDKQVYEMMPRLEFSDEQYFVLSEDESDQTPNESEDYYDSEDHQSVCSSSDRPNNSHFNNPYHHNQHFLTYNTSENEQISPIVTLEKLPQFFAHATNTTAAAAATPQQGALPQIQSTTTPTTAVTTITSQTKSNFPKQSSFRNKYAKPIHQLQESKFTPSQQNIEAASQGSKQQQQPTYEYSAFKSYQSQTKKTSDKESETSEQSVSFQLLLISPKQSEYLGNLNTSREDNMPMHENALDEKRDHDEQRNNDQLDGHTHEYQLYQEHDSYSQEGQLSSENMQKPAGKHTSLFSPQSRIEEASIEDSPTKQTITLDHHHHNHPNRMLHERPSELDKGNTGIRFQIRKGTKEVVPQKGEARPVVLEDQMKKQQQQTGFDQTFQKINLPEDDFEKEKQRVKAQRILMLKKHGASLKNVIHSKSASGFHRKTSSKQKTMIYQPIQQPTSPTNNNNNNQHHHNPKVPPFLKRENSFSLINRLPTKKTTIHQQNQPSNINANSAENPSQRRESKQNDAQQPLSLRHSNRQEELSYRKQLSTRHQDKNKNDDHHFEKGKSAGMYDNFSKVSLDNLKNYDIYFPEHNYALIIKAVGSIRLKKQTEQYKKVKKRLQKEFMKGSQMFGDVVVNASQAKLSKFYNQITMKMNAAESSTPLKNSQMLENYMTTPILRFSKVGSNRSIMKNNDSNLDSFEL